jgi:FkbM family methyltransferase
VPIAREIASVAPLVQHLGRSLVVADVGCRWGFSRTWEPFRPHILLIGFDPDAEECSRLERRAAGEGDVRFVPAALGPSRRRATLHLTREPACSSLYPPDLEAMRLRPELSLIEPVGTARVRLTTLDRWAADAGVERIDVLKLDTQGSELDILKGARRMLATIRTIEVEVEFNPIYRNQPLFGDVDRFLRRRGFVLWRLGHLVHYGLAEAPSRYTTEDRQFFDSRDVSFPAQGGQLYWGHAYYIPRALAFWTESADWRDHLRDACVAVAFDFRDLAGSALLRALSAAPPEIADQIRPALCEEA